MLKSFGTKITLILITIIVFSCKEKALNDEVQISELYLPDMGVLFEDYNQIDSTKNYQPFANKIFTSNSDLNSSELYVYAAMFYAQAKIEDSVIIALNKAIDFGMSNPNIIDKYQWKELIKNSSLYPDLENRLDSISNQLKEVDNFSLELSSMSQFWSYLDRALADTTNANSIFKDYIFEGPQELRDYYVLRYESPLNMSHQMVKTAPKYYQYLKQQFNEDSIRSMKNQIEGWMKGFKSIYPEAVFPKVYVVPGILNSGGTASEMGMFVGGDMYGKSENMPIDGLSDWQKNSIMVTSDMAPLIMHELMHFEQNYEDDQMNSIVKGKIIQEGVCDFMVELLTGNPLKNGNIEFLNDQTNWNTIVKDFRTTRDTDDFSKWMYNGGNIKDRPSDLGYTLGYLISKSYYSRHKNKKEAIFNLLNTNDVNTIYKESNYAYLLN